MQKFSLAVILKNARVKSFKNYTFNDVWLDLWLMRIWIQKILRMPPVENRINHVTKY